MLCERVREVDILPALRELKDTPFVDTRGLGGHISFPLWAMDFAISLKLGKVAHVVVRKLPAYQGIPPHIDEERVERWANVGTRYHVPLITHPGVTIRWPEHGEEYHLEAGWLYTVDYSKTHEVVNRSPVDRIHLVMNVVEPVLAVGDRYTIEGDPTVRRIERIYGPP